jgi:hypothetical protein
MNRWQNAARAGIKRARTWPLMSKHLRAECAGHNLYTAPCNNSIHKPAARLHCWGVNGRRCVRSAITMMNLHKRQLVCPAHLISNHVHVSYTRTRILSYRMSCIFDALQMEHQSPNRRLCVADVFSSGFTQMRLCSLPHTHAPSVRRRPRLIDCMSGHSK